MDLAGKGAKLDKIIDENKYKLDILAQGFKLYEDYTNQLINDIPEQYREAAKNGQIAIETFAGDAGEKTLEAINNYREWAKKVADVQQQMEELVQTIADLAKQKFDIIDDRYSNKVSLLENQIDRLNDSVSLIEKKGNIAYTGYYSEMSKITEDRLAKLKEEHKLLQESLDASVAVGDIKVESDQWYEMVEAIYDVDSEIAKCVEDIEEFQNSINDIYWDNFDELINRLGYISNETEDLINLMEKSGELIDYPKDAEYWTSDDVAWSKEGLASIGLYAQKMEIAEYAAEQYANAINDLSNDYAKGKYSENEYLKKLDELKKAQHDSIQDYYDAQDAIVSLNKTRIDAIRNGIEKEVSAYEKLISKQKEALNQEKDAYSFQKNLNAKQKSVSDIERKIAALSGDYSASAVAQRKKLEAELLTAQEEVNETLYDRNIENQQNALDKELESFKELKDKEIEGWEKYLEDVKKVVADSLNTVSNNTIDIYNTLQDKASEYNLTLSTAVTTPWKDGINAVSSYQEKFNTASSSTYQQLEKIKNQWQDIINLMIEASKTDINNINADNKAHVGAQKKDPEPPPVVEQQPQDPINTTESQPSLSKGSTVTVKKTATHFASGAKMASFVPGGSYTVYQTKDDRVLIGKNGVYTGWVWRKDLNGYKNGSKKIQEDQFAITDELGEELTWHAGQNGKLQYLTKGSSVIPSDITENLVKLGSMNLQEVLDRSRATVGVNPAISNNNVTIDVSYGDVVHIDNFSGNNLDELKRIVTQQFEQHTKNLNDSLRRYTR